MPTSHKWNLSLKCPKCGGVGGVSVVEDGGPPFTDEPRRTYAVRGNFALKPGGADSATCLTCNSACATGP